MSKEFPAVYNKINCINLISFYFSIFLKEIKSVNNNVPVKCSLPVYQFST